MSIERAGTNDMEECLDILYTQELGMRYYPSRKLLREELIKSCSASEIFVKKITMSEGDSIEHKILGIIWYQQEGMFHSFPYLHMIAVRKDCRNQGVGAELLQFLEDETLKNGKNKIRTKIFLTVGDFNKNAEVFYRNRGYIELCKLEDLFRKGITESLLMKIITAKV